MPRTLILLALSALLPGVIPSLRGSDPNYVWRWSNPTPHGNHIFDLVTANATTIQICEKGQIYTSEDLTLWTPRESHTTNALRAGCYFGDRLLISGQNGTIVYADALDGFTLLSLGSTDWLEGIAASPSVAVTVGDNGAIYSSGDGVNWQRRGAFTNWFRSVAYGGGRFLAVGERGAIVASTNGIVWESKPLGIAIDLNRAVWQTDRFWVLGNAGAIYTNTSRFNWQSANSGTTNALYGGAANASEFLAVGDLEARLKHSATQAWVNHLTANPFYPVPSWTYYCSAWTGLEFLIGGHSGMFVEGFQTSATSAYSWITTTSPPRNWLWSVTRTPEFYAAVGDHAAVMLSANGADWELEVTPDSVALETLLGIGGTTNLLVAAGSGGTLLVSSNSYTNSVSTNSAGARVTNQVSVFGVVWKAVTSTSSNDLQGVCSGSNLYVVTGARGTILTSSNGQSWTARSSGTTNYLSSVTAFPGGFVAVGDVGTILTSSNGISWVKRPAPTTNWIYQVKFLGGLLVGVGENRTIVTSQDGAAWTVRNSGTSEWLNGIDFAGDSYFAVGDKGLLLRSTNAVTWTPLPMITQKALYGAATDGAGQLVVVGVEGSILRTQVSPFTTPVNFLLYNRVSNQDLFLLKGRRDQRFYLDSSTNLTDWAVVKQLEIADPSGTLLHAEASNSIPKNIFRTRSAP